jgi:methylthioribulose-1-phosphate dehydratase
VVTIVEALAVKKQVQIYWTRARQITETRPMNFADAQLGLVAVSYDAHAKGWVPATSGNFSARLANGEFAITVSGKDKGKLLPDDIMQVALDGTPESTSRPSAETLLHSQLYKRDENIGAVLHTHSLNATIASQDDSDRLCFSQLEILKAFAGIESHEASITIPIFRNQQDIAALADEVERYMCVNGQGIAYLIAGHGLYTWGADIDESMRHLEALEYLFEYERLKSAESGRSGNE